MTAIQYTNPITYKIKDTNNEQIQGTFYEQEMQKSHQDTFRIDKVLKTKGNKLFVKWKGYPDSFNSWINKSDVLSLHNVKH
jgi:Chromo (CHRromatin Organisation MOdifier) domain